MGRPLNKKFFGDPVGGGFQIACTADVGSGNVTAHIVSQRSNSKYLVAETATPANNLVCTLVNATPSAVGEMQVTVQPENAQSVVQATVTITQTGGIIDTVVIANAGYGYWAAGTAVSIAGGTAGTLDYTVSNGSLASVALNGAGTGYSDSTQNIGDAPDADPPLQNARIINARTVKTFPAVGGNTYLWPIVGVDDGAGPSGRTEADLQGS